MEKSIGGGNATTLRTESSITSCLMDGAPQTRLTRSRKAHNTAVNPENSSTAESASHTGPSHRSSHKVRQGKSSVDPSASALRPKHKRTDSHKSSVRKSSSSQRHSQLEGEQINRSTSRQSKTSPAFSVQRLPLTATSFSSAAASESLHRGGPSTHRNHEISNVSEEYRSDIKGKGKRKENPASTSKPRRSSRRFNLASSTAATSVPAKRALSPAPGSSAQQLGSKRRKGSEIAAGSLNEPTSTTNGRFETRLEGARSMSSANDVSGRTLADSTSRLKKSTQGNHQGVPVRCVTDQDEQTADILRSEPVLDELHRHGHVNQSMQGDRANHVTGDTGAEEAQQLDDVDCDEGEDEYDEEEEEDDDEDDEDGDEEQQERIYEDEDMDDALGDGGLGADFTSVARLAGYLSGAQSRYKELLTSLRAYTDPSTQLVALQELSEALSLANEETLAGHFPIEAYIKELIYIMGGPKPLTKPNRSRNGTGRLSPDNDEEKEDDDAARAAALAAADLVDRGEMTLLACRCLTNLLEAMPYAAHTIVTLKAIPVLLSKLTEIEFIDLAEQTLQTLEKVSAEIPSAIVAEGGLMAMLQFIDFFNIHIQRTAMTAAANCCRKLTALHLDKVKNVVPIIRNVLGYVDQRLVESACKCIVRIIESFRHQADLLEELLDKDMMQALNALLLHGSPAPRATGMSSASTSIGTSTYTDVLKSFGSAVRASSKLAVVLLETHVVETLYHLLTGAPAPREDGEGGSGPAAIKMKDCAVPALQLDTSAPTTSEAEAVAVVGKVGKGDVQHGVAVADLAVLQNLAHRPKEQIQEALSLVSDLLPPLPRDGIFDPRRYSEKAWHKRRKAVREVKFGGQSSAVVNSAIQGSGTACHAHDTEASRSATTEVDALVTEKTAEDAEKKPLIITKPERVKTEKEIVREEAQAKRVEMLRNRRGLVERFTQLVLPTLIEVYAASVSMHIRVKALNGLLKIVNFVDASTLAHALDPVPLASFVASILSSRDDPNLVHPALQLVELLCDKLPQVYSSLLRREGVMWEIDDIASQTPKTIKYPSTSYSEKISNQPLSAAADGNVIEGTASTSIASASPAVVSSVGSALGGDGSSSDALGRIPGLPGGLASVNITRRPVVASFSDFSTAEIQDSIIWRSRILRDIFVRQDATAEGGADQAVKALEEVKANVAALKVASSESEDAIVSALDAIMRLFAKPDQPISCFELLRSGLIDGLYDFATGGNSKVARTTRRKLLIDALMTPDSTGSQSRASTLVKRLQETLNRLENVDIITVINGSEDTRRYGDANINRQLRLRLQADTGTEMPVAISNVIVSIHAIASFERLADFIRPKLIQANSADGISGDTLAARRARLTSMLAALSGAGSSTFDSGGTTSAGEFVGGSTRARREPSVDLSKNRRSAIKGPEPAPGIESTAQTAASSMNAGNSSTPRKNARRSPTTSHKSTEGPTDTSNPHNCVPRRSPEGDSEQASETNDDVVVRETTHKPAGRRDAMSPDETTHQLMESLLAGVDEDEYEDQDMGDEIWEDEVGPEALRDNSAAEDKTVNLSVDDDGSKVDVKTLDGTRIPTPSGAATTSSSSTARTASAATSSVNAGPSSSRAASGQRASYAAALQRKPEDWHVEFSMGERALPLDSTIYSAVHRFETESTREGTGTIAKNVWNNVYTIKFRKTPGATPQQRQSEQTPEPSSHVTAGSAALPASVPADTSFAKILQLLRLLYDLNSEWRESLSADSVTSGRSDVAAPLGDEAFVNNKLTAKLNRQLEEPMIVASKCLPDWSLQLPRGFPFLFPFEARYAFVQLTAFGYNRMLHRWQSLTARNAEPPSSSRSAFEDLSFANLVRLPRAKVRISRESILSSAFRVMELYGSKDSILEVEYFDEVGTGLGPTLEFYTLTSKEFARKGLDLWRDEGSADSQSKFVYAPHGLFPAPVNPKSVDTAEIKARLEAFKILGQFVAKALLDSRIIDCNFSPVFMRALLNQSVAPTLNSLAMVDPTLAASLRKLYEMSKPDLESLCLDFTLPGVEGVLLKESGNEAIVTADNLQEYVDAVVDMSVSRGIEPAVRAFRQGFNCVFPIAAMASFSADELVMLFGNSDEDWSEATLLSSIKPDHGYTTESPAFRNLILLMASYDVSERREFLQWLTGSPKLPIGGFAGLQPQLTVVKRPHEAPLTPDDYLASNMSCANFLKLPQYSSLEVMRKRLQTAVREGAGAFNLS